MFQKILFIFSMLFCLHSTIKANFEERIMGAIDTQKVELMQPKEYQLYLQEVREDLLARLDIARKTILLFECVDEIARGTSNSDVTDQKLHLDDEHLIRINDDEYLINVDNFSPKNTPRQKTILEKMEEQLKINWVYESENDTENDVKSSNSKNIEVLNSLLPMLCEIRSLNIRCLF